MNEKNIASDNEIAYLRAVEAAALTWLRASGLDTPTALTELAEVLESKYAAEHPADDDKLVTRDWLLSVGFLRDGEDPSEAVAKKIWDKFQSEDYGEEPAMQVLVETKDSSVWLEAYSKDGDTLALIELGIGKTRGDVRRLCQALGIELKGTT